MQAWLKWLMTQHLMNSINHRSVNTLWHLGTELVNRRKLDRISLLCSDILGFFFFRMQSSEMVQSFWPCDHRVRGGMTTLWDFFWSLKIYASHGCQPNRRATSEPQSSKVILYEQWPRVNRLLNVMCCFASSPANNSDLQKKKKPTGINLKGSKFL